MSEVLTPAEPAAAPQSPPRAPFRWRPVLLGLALLAAGAAAGVVASRAIPPTAPAEKSPESEKKPDAGDTVAFSKEKQSAAGVEVAPVEAKPLASVAWRTGRVALNEDRLAHISPPADGIVREVPVRIGQTVEPGTVLAVIDCRELGLAKLELAKARAALAVEQNQLERVRTTTTNATELLKLLDAESPPAEIEKRMANRPVGESRAALLGAYTKRNQLRVQVTALKASGSAVAESTVRRAQADADAADAAYTALVEELRYQVKQQTRQAELKAREAEVAVDALRGRLMTFGLSAAQAEAADPLAEGEKASLLPVKAPFRGTVVDKHAVPSERIDARSQLFVLADLSSVWVQADVFEADLPMVRGLAGKAVFFRSSVANIPERRATVLYAGDLIEKGSRAMALTARAENPNRDLKPGMFVEVGFDLTDPSPVLQVPRTAILWHEDKASAAAARHESKPFVFVATGEDIFAKREVALGRAAGDVTEITAGLKAGERVVVRGGFVLKSEMLKDQMVGE
jgi:RND family efflux transporter MFP subunit